jgi:ATP-dependent Lon protease
MSNTTNTKFDSKTKGGDKKNPKSSVKHNKKCLKKRNDSSSEEDIGSCDSDEEDDSEDYETVDSEDDDDDEDGEEDEDESFSEENSESISKHKKSKKTNKKTNKKGKKYESEEYEEEDSENEEDNDFDRKAFRKTLMSLFPSEYSKQKYEKTDEKPSKKKTKSSHKKNTKSPKKKTKRETPDSYLDHSSDDSDDDNYDPDQEEIDRPGLNLILSMSGMGGMMSGNAVDEEYEQLLEEEPNEVCNSDDEKTFMKESYETILIPPTPSMLENIDSGSSEQVKNSKKHSSKRSQQPNIKKDKNKETNKTAKNVEKKEEKTMEDEEIIVNRKYAELIQLKKELTIQLERKPHNKILRNAVEECRNSISKLIKKSRVRNMKTYYKLVNGEDEDKQNNSELSYFKNKCSHKEQIRIMRDLKEINTFTNIDKPYRLSILESNIPAKFKAIVLQKLKVLRSMEPGDPEYYKLKNWVDGFMRVPFGKYKNLTVNLNDGIDACNSFIENAKNTLDNCAFGLDDAKLQILQMVGQWISNPGAMGTAIAIKGPMGTGKTTLVKEGISKILGREFAFIALGGAGDSSFLEGHSYTYEGSSWGKIIQILMESKCMNPVIYFDELDKISETPRGEEIIGILTHLTDTSQNSEFHDKYFSEVAFDLSKCLFIFSYNDESKVNAILRDRMYRIQTKGYDTKEKIVIARKHLLPKIIEQVSFKPEDVIIPDDTLQYIINSADISKNEQGVRNLKRALEIVHTKLNLFRLIKSDNNLLKKDIDLGDVVFPFTVTKKHIDVLIKKEEQMSQSLLAMYC